MLEDLRFAFRSLARSKAASAVAAGSVALVVAANTATFSVINAFLVRPLPFPDAERLVLVWESERARTDDRSPFSPANFRDVAARSRSFEALAAYTERTVGVSGEGEPESVLAAVASPALLRILRARPLVGRLFDDADALPGAGPVVLLTYPLWQRRYGGRVDVVGRSIAIDRVPHLVVGVLPEHFEFVESRIGLWLPYVLDPATTERAERSIALLVGKLRKGVGPDAARAELAAIAAALEKEHPETNRGYGIAAFTFREVFPGPTDTRLLAFLQGGAFFVLLIACANVANLLLARAQARQEEIVVRAALGAGRLRIARQLLTESLVLAGLGGAVGTAGGIAAVGALRRALAGEIPHAFLPVVDHRVLAFSLGVSVLAGIVFGLAPAVHAARFDLAAALKEGGERAAPGGRGWLRRALVVGQVALALALLSGASILLRSFLAAQYADPGFDDERLLVFRLAIPERVYDEPAAAAFVARLVDELRALPGVEAAMATTSLPRSRGTPATEVVPADRPVGEGEAAPRALWVAVTPGYFRGLGVPLLEGRPFEEADRAGAPPVAVVDEVLAERLWPGESALGRRLVVLGREREIVGVVAHVLQRRLGDFGGASPMVYLPLAQEPSRSVGLLVRTRLDDPALVAPAVRAAVGRLDAALPVADLVPFEEFVARQFVGARVLGVLIAAFGLVALGLASIGLYGVLAYGVALRTRELGIRLAFGAAPRDVVRLVLREGAALAAAGLALALPAVWVIERLIEGTLVGLAAGAATTVSAIAAVLLAVLFLASLLPARRAAALSPVEALRTA